MLKTMIVRYSRERKSEIIIDAYNNGEQLIKCSKKYHIIFLDIQMDIINGIDLAKSIRKFDKNVKIIYVTNYTNYQVDAFSVRAFGYVVKPYTYEVVCKQLDDAIEYSKSNENTFAFTFETDVGIKTLNANSIFYFESCNHKVEIVTDKRTYKISEKINDIIQTFKPFGFSMPHKSFVINLQYISSIKGYDVVLTNGNLIPISQKRAVQFKEEFHIYLRNNFNLLDMR